MADGRQRDEWNRTSHIMAEITNATPGRGRHTVSAAQRNPYHVADSKKNAPKITSVSLLARMMGIPVPDKDGE